MKSNKKKQAAAQRRAKKRGERIKSTQKDKAKRKKELKELREAYEKQLDDYVQKLLGQVKEKSEETPKEQ